MRVTLLGPLGLEVDGQPVAVPPGRQRALLAVLALTPGRVVSADRLVDVLWGESLPANPTNALQGRISQLRKLVGRDRVVQQGTGYLLDVPDDAIDIHRFAQAVARGHAALVAGDHDAALAVLGGAMDVWAGPALAEFADEDWAVAEAYRLTELRHTAFEDRVEAELALGRHGMLVAPLEEAVADRPLRERLRGQLMLALVRSGRQADALAVYDQGRRLLGDELGVDPGPELQALHAAVLRQDRAVVTPPLERAAHAPSAGNLPTPVSSFVGRDQALEQLQRLLDRARLVTLTGPGGAGKTRLAIEAARQATRQDGPWLVELAALRRADEIPAAVAAALNIDTTGALTGSGPDVRSRVLSALAERDVLLVLDNCEHLVDACAQLAHELVTRAPRVTVLATSREVLGVPGEAVWSVPSLGVPTEDTLDAVLASPAGQLLLERARDHRPDLEIADDDVTAVVAICRRLDGIPLALELAAARMRVLGWQELATALDDRFAVLTGGGRTVLPRQQTLHALVDWSWQLLPDTHRRALTVLAGFAATFTLSDAGGVLRRALPDEPVNALDVVAELSDRSLVTTDHSTTPTRVRLLETIRDFARNAAQDLGLGPSIADAHTDWILQRTATLRAHDPARWDVDLDAGEQLLDDARLVLQRAEAVGDRDLAQRMLADLGAVLWLRGHADDARLWLHWALDGPIAHPQAAVWGVLLDTGPERTQRGLAWCKAASRTATGPDRDLVQVFGALVTATAGRPVEAADQLDALLADLSTPTWTRGTGNLIRAIAAGSSGDLATATAMAEAADADFATTGAWWGRLYATDMLATIAEARGDYDTAIQQRRRALETAEAAGVTEQVTVHLAQLGNLAVLTADLDHAADLHARAAARADRAGDRSMQALVANGAGLAARRRGELTEATAQHIRARELYRELGTVGGEAFALAGLGFAAEQSGDAKAATAHHHAGLEAAASTGDPRAVALALEGLAGAASLQDDRPRTAVLLAAASALRIGAGAPLPPAERVDVDRIRTRAGLTEGDTSDLPEHLDIPAAVALAST